MLPDIKHGDPKLGNPAHDQIVGIVSFGNDCCRRMKEGSVSTQVNRFLPWLFRTIGIATCNIKVVMNVMDSTVFNCIASA